MNERMPWGKYKGWLLSECPTSYLIWVYREANAAKSWLKSAISDELNRRARQEVEEESFAAPAELRSTIKTCMPAWPATITPIARRTTARSWPPSTMPRTAAQPGGPEPLRGHAWGENAMTALR
jgi:hypothetical protein